MNETRPRSYWFDRFAEFAKAVSSRAHLKLCVSCRTSFLPVCLPKDFADQAVEHIGFAGMEREACNAFFSHYHLEPPLVPVLQPELANPLYLKLVCETLEAKGLKQLPKGWFGMAPVIRAFLAHKEEQFATEHSVSSGAAIVSGSLHAFVGEYPWASVCNVETDDWLGFDTKVRGSNLEFVPVFNEVVCEWEYDGTLPSSINFYLPARDFFKAGPLWWNSVDGFSTPDGKTVFRDPSASEGGPATLLADLDDLLPRLERLGARLVWTLLGEKYVLGDEARDSPRVTYSQTAFLNKDRTICFRDRVFFDDHHKDQGLAL